MLLMQRNHITFVQALDKSYDNTYHQNLYFISFLAVSFPKQSMSLINLCLRLPLVNMLELFTCTLMLPATFIMIFSISYGNFTALKFPCCHQLFLSSCFKESSKFWRQFQAAKFCKFQYASVLLLNAAETSTILPPF